MKLTKQERAEFISIRRAQDAVIPVIADNPAAINEAVAMTREWTPGVYTGAEVRQYGGIPYKCVQAHDSTANPGWTPPTVPALWMQYHGTSSETARPYIPPLGAHDAYRVDEYAIEGGTVYRCKVDNTVFPPSTLPGSWEAVGGAAEPESTEPDNPDEPTPTLPQAWDDFPANHLFAVGDEFSDKGTVYVVLREFNKQEGWRPPALTGNFYKVKG